MAPPGERPCNLPPACVAPPRAPVSQRRLPPVPAGRANQLSPPPRQALAQRLRVTRAVVNHAGRSLARAAGAGAGRGHRLRRRPQPCHPGRGRRVPEVSQRDTSAVDHHPPLRPLATCGPPDPGPPVFAGAQLPSARASAHSRWPWASSWANKARQALSRTSGSSQPRTRRQQVRGDGKRAGRSCHRAPDRKRHRRPSKTGRFEMGCGPPRGEAVSSGNKGAIFSRWASVSAGCARAIGRTPVAAYDRGRRPSMQMPICRGYETASSQMVGSGRL
jgi:hypothetical protein